MNNYSDIEDKIIEQLTLPYIYYPQQNLNQKTLLAKHTGSVYSDELLLPSCFMFAYSAVIAGLSEKNVEYIAKNAPIDYKKELANPFVTEYRMKEVFEIAKVMDEDLGIGIMQNQKRIERVYQYIKDNWVAFQF